METAKLIDRHAVFVHGWAFGGSREYQALPLAERGPRCVAYDRPVRLRVYERAPRGLLFTHTDHLNTDLRDFIRG